VRRVSGPALILAGLLLAAAPAAAEDLRLTAAG